MVIEVMVVVLVMMMMMLEGQWCSAELKLPLSSQRKGKAAVVGEDIGR